MICTNSFLLLLLTLSFVSLQPASGKETICHIPPGKPDKPKTIQVGSAAAVEAHLSHGDSLGPCGESTPSIAVLVLDFLTNLPIAGASVEYSFVGTGSTGEFASDETGFVIFEPVPVEGTFIIQAFDPVTGATGSAEGQLSASNLAASVQVALDIAGTSTLSGTVLDEESSAPVEGVAITYLFTVSGRTGSAVSDSNGKFIFQGLQSDGVLAILAFDTTTFASGSTSTFISSDNTNQVADVLLSPPVTPNVELLNGGFAAGLESWDVTGPATVFERSNVFAEQVTEDPNLRRLQIGCPVTNAALISTAGETNGLGKLSQTFTVPPGYELIRGRVQFLSNEWPDFFGSEYNDNFLVTLTTSAGLQVLSKGSLNGLTWTDGPKQGFNGFTKDFNFEVPLKGLAGQNVKITYEVRDVGDLIFDSGLAIDATQVYRTEDFVVAPSLGGPTTGPLTVKGQLGQVVRITVKNLNVLGTTVRVRDLSVFGQTKDAAILPLSSVTFDFGIFGNEPMFREFDIRTIVSDAYIVDITVESTWVEGMPPNPCF